MAGESADDLARRQREKAERLVQSAARYERGAEGERRTAMVLDALAGYGYVAVHDLKWPGRQRANIDHVLVGPSGVYVIDSKNWSGRVGVSQGTLRQNGYRRDQELVSCGEAALALVRTLNTDVVPVLCLVREEEISGKAQNVHVCTTSNVQRFILSRRTILTVEQVRWIVMVLRGEVPAANARSQQTQVVNPQAAPRSRQTTRTGQRKRSNQPVRERGGGGREVILWGALIIAGLFAFRFVDDLALPDIAGIAGTATGQESSSLGFGSRHAITEDGVNVSVRVGEPVDTKSRHDGAFVKNGMRLVSVPVVIRNSGTRKWVPNSTVRWRAEDSLGNTAPGWVMTDPVHSGRRLPNVRAVWPGKPHRGVLVFEVPKGLRLEAVSIQTSTFGGLDATWSATGSE